MNASNNGFPQQVYSMGLNVPQNGFNAVNPFIFTLNNEMLIAIQARNDLIIRLLEQQNALQMKICQQNDLPQRETSAPLNRNTENQSFRHDESNKLQTLSLRPSLPADLIEQNCNVKTEQQQVNIIKSVLPQKEMEFTQEINSSLPYTILPNKQQSQKFQKKGKKNQTKNIVKNFAKSIFSYIRRNRDKKMAVLEYLGINESDFDQAYQKYKGHIHSITELRLLWSAQGNPFHKAFRILSSQYLRRDCWARTFNSRVENYGIHLKYRIRLLEVIEDPAEFKALKVN